MRGTSLNPDLGSSLNPDLCSSLNTPTQQQNPAKGKGARLEVERLTYLTYLPPFLTQLTELAKATEPSPRP